MVRITKAGLGASFLSGGPGLAGQPRLAIRNDVAPKGKAKAKAKAKAKGDAGGGGGGGQKSGKYDKELADIRLNRALVFFRIKWVVVSVPQ